MPEKNIKDAQISQMTVGDPEAGAGEDANIRVNPNSGFPVISMREGTTPRSYWLCNIASGETAQTFTDRLSFLGLPSGEVQVSIVNEQGIIIYDVDSSPSPIGGAVRMWSGSGEAKVMDASGNITTFSPHNFEGIELDPADPYPVTIHHQNPYLGTEQWIYMSKMARLVEGLTGQQIVYSQDITKRDWAADETAAQERRTGEIDAWLLAVANVQDLEEEQREAVLKVLGDVPEPYTTRTEPDWIKNRKDSRG